MPVTIIAEAGVNHNGSLEMAKEMARVAKECGADIVKYQTAVPELVVSKFAEKAEYQKQTTDAAESQLEMIRKLHFSFEAHKELKEYCDSIGIQYLSAPFDVPSVKFLGTLGLPLLKIPSGEITNLPYLEAMAAQKTPVLLSTGMSTLSRQLCRLDFVFPSHSRQPQSLSEHYSCYCRAVRDGLRAVFLYVCRAKLRPARFSDNRLGQAVPKSSRRSGAVRHRRCSFADWLGLGWPYRHRHRHFRFCCGNGSANRLPHHAL